MAGADFDTSVGKALHEPAELLRVPRDELRRAGLGAGQAARVAGEDKAGGGDRLAREEDERGVELAGDLARRSRARMSARSVASIPPPSTWLGTTSRARREPMIG
jgi:hypothetical protein